MDAHPARSDLPDPPLQPPDQHLHMRAGDRRLLRPASHPASRPRTGASPPGTLASPRTGRPPA